METNSLSTASGSMSSLKSAMSTSEEQNNDDDGSSGTSGVNTGRWTSKEHRLFIEALKKHGQDWRRIAIDLKSRNNVQVRTHAQKYFKKLERMRKRAAIRGTKKSSGSGAQCKVNKRARKALNNSTTEEEDDEDDDDDVVEGTLASQSDMYRVDATEMKTSYCVQQSHHRDVPQVSTFAQARPSMSVNILPSFLQRIPTVQPVNFLPISVPGYNMAPQQHCNPAIVASQMMRQLPAQFVQQMTPGVGPAFGQWQINQFGQVNLAMQPTGNGLHQLQPHFQLQSKMMYPLTPARQPGF